MIRKQITFNLSVEEWLALRREAAQLRIPITELCRQLMAAGRERLTERKVLA